MAEIVLLCLACSLITGGLATWITFKYCLNLPCGIVVHDDFVRLSGAIAEAHRLGVSQMVIRVWDDKKSTQNTVVLVDQRMELERLLRVSP